MLLRFGVENYRSLWRPQQLSLIPTRLHDNESGLLKWGGRRGGGQALSTAILYGANASGKSTVIDALETIRTAITYSHRHWDPKGGVGFTPFALDPKAVKRKARFDIDFVVDSIRYHYGFEANRKEFTSEWLYSFPNGRRTLLFERSKSSFEFGRELKGRNKVIADLTRPNSLFLSAAIQNDHKQLTKVARFFDETTVNNVGDTDFDSPDIDKTIRHRSVDKRAIEFLRRIDTGVVGWRRKTSPVPPEALIFQRDLVSLLQKAVGDREEFSDLMREKRSEIQLAHQGVSGAAVYMDFDSESLGTKRLLALLCQVFKALDSGSLLVVDELDASLHTQVGEGIIGLFSRRRTNPKGAQLVATTHDTNLLLSSFLRRDQIWFAEKDVAGATRLFALSDIKTRKEDNFEKGYLQGRYGAIPFSGSISQLLEKSPDLA